MASVGFIIIADDSAESPYSSLMLNITLSIPSHLQALPTFDCKFELPGNLLGFLRFGCRGFCGSHWSSSPL